MSHNDHRISPKKWTWKAAWEHLCDICNIFLLWEKASHTRCGQWNAQRNEIILEQERANIVLTILTTDTEGNVKCWPLMVLECYPAGMLLLALKYYWWLQCLDCSGHYKIRTHYYWLSQWLGYCPGVMAPWKLEFSDNRGSLLQLGFHGYCCGGTKEFIKQCFLHLNSMSE